MIIPNKLENKRCSEPPTSLGRPLRFAPHLCTWGPIYPLPEAKCCPLLSCTLRMGNMHQVPCEMVLGICWLSLKLFDWQLTVIGQKGSPVKCPYGPTVANGTRLCGGNFSSGGVWKDPDVSNCKFKSERTNKLNALAKVCKTFLKTLFFLNTGKKRSPVQYCRLSWKTPRYICKVLVSF